MAEVAANKRKMKELEDNLLYHLTSTKGSLVEDETLIEALTVTKETAHEVTEKLSISAETEVRINAAREEFRPGEKQFLVRLSLRSSKFRNTVNDILSTAHGVAFMGTRKCNPLPPSRKSFYCFISKILERFVSIFECHEVWIYYKITGQIYYILSLL